jgi:hypothetical protein
MIDKSLYSSGLAPSAEGITIGIEAQEPLEMVLELPDGGAEVTLEAGSDTLPAAFDANLAEYIDEGLLGSIASDLVADIDADIESRKDWADAFVAGLEVLGMKYEERTEPWVGACGVYSTVLTEAAVRFQSETIMEVFPAAGPVKTEIMGAIDKVKEEASKRVAEDMNYQLTEVMTEYRSEHERLLYSLGLAGAAFKKIYKDPSLGRQVSMFVPAEDLVMPYGASNIETAERVTHVMRKTPNEIRKLQVAGFYRDCDLGDPTQQWTDIEEKKAEEQGYSLTNDDRFQLFESHVNLDIDAPGLSDPDGIARPYVVTLERGTSKILAIRRNWKEGDELKLKRQHFVQYTYIPGFGVYGMGLIHLIGGYARAGTSIIRQLVDAGTLANLPGGLKARGLRVIGDDTPIAPGEFRDVDLPSGSIKDNIMTLPYKEPSQVLAALLQQITDEGRRLGAIADMKVSDMSAQAPVGTTLAILERQLKTMSAVQARVHFAMRREFRLLKEIIRDNAKEYDYTPQGGTPQVKKQDYDMVDVLPVSDPNSSTMAQRIAQYQAVYQMSQGAPQIYDLPQLHRQMLDVLGVANAEKIIPLDEDMKPRDPISENMAVLKGDPVKAFMHQDHDAHIAVHSLFMQDPMIGQQLGQNPMAQQLMAALQAHIAEHLGFQYRKQIEEQLGVVLPPPDENLPPDLEVELSGLIARASVQLSQLHKQAAAQAQAQQNAQDPLLQIELQGLEVKKAEVQRKAAKDAADNQIKQQELALKAQDSQGNVAEKQQELALKAQEGAMELQQKAQEGQLKLSQQQEQLRQRLIGQGLIRAQQEKSSNKDK